MEEEFKSGQDFRCSYDNNMECLLFLLKNLYIAVSWQRAIFLAKIMGEYEIRQVYRYISCSQK